MALGRPAVVQRLQFSVGENLVDALNALQRFADSLRAALNPILANPILAMKNYRLNEQAWPQPSSPVLLVLQQWQGVNGWVTIGAVLATGTLAGASLSLNPIAMTNTVGNTWSAGQGFAQIAVFLNGQLIHASRYTTAPAAGTITFTFTPRAGVSAVTVDCIITPP